MIIYIYLACVRAEVMYLPHCATLHHGCGQGARAHTPFVHVVPLMTKRQFQVPERLCVDIDSRRPGVCKSVSVSVSVCVCVCVCEREREREREREQDGGLPSQAPACFCRT